jgi:hypothetical protein
LSEILLFFLLSRLLKGVQSSTWQGVLLWTREDIEEPFDILLMHRPKDTLSRLVVLFDSLLLVRMKKML